MGQLAAQLFHGLVCVIPSLSHLQGADKRSRVHFKCAICIWNLLLLTLNMRSKKLSLSVKQAIIRLKNRNKPIREIAKTLGVAKSTVWNILKKKERTGELSNTKRPGRPRKTTVVDEPKNSFPGEENTLHNSWPDPEHSPGGRCMCVKVNNQEKTSPE
jgi:transposase-like protein